MRTVHSREAYDTLTEHFGDKVFEHRRSAPSIAYAESAERARLDPRPPARPRRRLPRARRRGARAPRAGDARERVASLHAAGRPPERADDRARRPGGRGALAVGRCAARRLRRGRRPRATRNAPPASPVQGARRRSVPRRRRRRSGTRTARRAGRGAGTADRVGAARHAAARLPRRARGRHAARAKTRVRLAAACVVGGGAARRLARRAGLASCRNGRIGWIRAGAALGCSGPTGRSTAIARARRLIVRHGARVVARSRIAVGRPGARDADRALRGHRQAADQPPRLALRLLRARAHRPPDASMPAGLGRRRPARDPRHATTPRAVGQAASLGCMRIDATVARRLVRTVPLGTQVRVEG